MDTTTQILSGLFGVAIVLLLAPRVFAMNRGRVLQNIALWVAIFLGLAVAYKVIGPGRMGIPAQDPAAQAQQGAAAPAEGSAPAYDARQSKDADPADTSPTLNEDQGFTPPREE